MENKLEWKYGMYAHEYMDSAPIIAMCVNCINYYS